MQKQDIYSELLAKKLSGNATAAEIKQLEELRNSSPENALFADKAEQLWSVSDKYKDEPFNADKTAAWQRIEANLEGEAKVVQLRPWRSLLRIAAAVLLIAGAFWMLNNPTEDVVSQLAVSTGPGENKKVELPDGSIIQLNENTSIQYAADFKKRNVDLEGEAFFDVARMEESPFVITAGGTTTRVLGTSFNIRAYPEESETELSVKTGKVAFAKITDTKEEEKQVRILTADQAVTFDKVEKNLEEPTVVGLNDMAWQSKELNFPSVPMSEVEEVLERYYKVEIKFSKPELRNCRFDAFGPLKNAELREVLDLLQAALDFTIIKSDEAYIISGEGCNPE